MTVQHQNGFAPSSLNPYDALLSGTRHLQDANRASRDRWFASLDLDHKAGVLFELEVLLKAAACFANPRNHAGQQRGTPLVARDFTSSLKLYGQAIERAAELTRQLLGPDDRAFLFQRYLETVLPEDNRRSRLVSPSVAQATPVDGLLDIRRSLANVGEVLEGLVRAPKVTFRTFSAILRLAQQGIRENAFFNPLTALEFRPEFDRIHAPEILTLIGEVPPGHPRRLVALTFLSLFRMLRYLDLLEAIVTETSEMNAGRVYCVLSVLRSDARALGSHLDRHAGHLLASGYRADLLRVPAGDLAIVGPALLAEASRLSALRQALVSVTLNLQLELRRVFSHGFPAPDGEFSLPSLALATRDATSQLRPSLRNAVHFLAQELGAELKSARVFNDAGALRESSARLRRDLWMFTQILRAFVEKAKHSPAQDAWTSGARLEYVSQFQRYFRSLGYPVMRSSAYPHSDAFVQALHDLQASPGVRPELLSRVVQECSALRDYLTATFEELNQSSELAGYAFNRREAASTLKMFLG